MDADTPTWLTKEFLEDVLGEGSERGCVVVDGFEVKSAIPKGNNYICDVLRVNINYTASDEGTETGERKEKSLIVKVPKTGGMSDWIMKTGVIQREMDVYNRLIPKLSAIYGESVFTAKSYKSSVENVLILDDLNSVGYKMADRRKQLGYEECRVALKALARFHAASVKYHEEDPEYIEGFEELFFSEQLFETQPQFVTGYFTVAAEEISKLPDCSRFLEKLHGCRDKARDTLLDLLAFKDNNFNVLNHGDFWITNMLFKYDEDGKPTDVKLIDLQVSKYNSPALDLAYIFTSSVQEETRTTRFRDLISEYVGELNATLERLGAKSRLEMDHLNEQIERFHFYELFISVAMLPLVLCNPEETIDIKDYVEDDLKNFTENAEFRKNYRTNQYQDVIAKKMADFEKKGLF